MKKLWCGSVILLLLLATSCTRYAEIPTGTRLTVTTPILEQTIVEVPIPSEQDLHASYDYFVGPGDILSITIPGQQKQVDAPMTPQGYRVYTSGKVLLPIVGGVHVAGLSVDEIQLKLQDVFKRFIKNPVVSVEILEFKSKPVYLLGSFNHAGVQYLDRQVSLIQGIALGGGLQETANLRGARVIRQEKVLPVDIYELMYNNDLRHNVPLRGGDTVFIPNNDAANVFVVGAVHNSGRVAMINGRLTLLQALSTAGMGSKANYNHREVRIVRSFSATRGELLVVDLERVLSGQALPMPLMDGDILYVPNTSLADWNEAIEMILPSLSAIGAILTPFVQMRYLIDDD